MLRDDLSGLAQWWGAWGSVLLGVTQWGVVRHPLPRRVVRGCSLHNQVLENVQSAKCLGIAVTDGFDWGRRVNNVASGAAGALCFLQRNLALAPGGCRVAACRAMVRPQLGCAAPIRSPCHQTEISRIEKVQKTAARWACRRWRNQSRVGEMLEELQWPELQERRQQASLTVFYKVHNSLVTVGGVGCLSWAGVGGFHPFWCRCPSACAGGLGFSFFPRTMATWNGLTTEAVSAETVDGFKSKI